MAHSPHQAQPFPLRLVRASERLLRAAYAGPAELANELGIVVPPGWPEFPRAIPATMEFLTLFPEQADWAMYFFVNDEAAELVGSGGFKGEPVDGVVEVGYEIAPRWRNQGAARAAVTQLIELGRRSGLVTVVAAETLPQLDASATVLRSLGFSRVPFDPQAGPEGVWRWELPCMS